MRSDADEHAGEQAAEQKGAGDSEDAAAAMRRAACATIRPSRPRRDAPRARRMPISCVRWETE